MRPYILMGHTRPITWVMYNREGDLLFTCGKVPAGHVFLLCIALCYKDVQVCLWFDADGSMIGTYEGHSGSVNTADITRNSERLLTASSDSSVRLWDVRTGKTLNSWTVNEPCRACAFSIGARIAAFATDRFASSEPQLGLIKVPEDLDELTDATHNLATFRARINRLKWTEENKVLIAAHEDGFIRKWNSETGQLLQEKQIHEGSIADMRFSSDLTHFATASNDKTAALVDARTLEVLKQYKFGSPVNAVDMSPTHDYVVLGGGQEAVDVAIKGSQEGNFEARFFHKIYAEEFGRVRGHFSPINALAFHPSGRGFVSGGEEGYVRLHKFDDDYFTTSFF